MVLRILVDYEQLLLIDLEGEGNKSLAREGERC
jgi:hypothetical protein